MSNVVILILAGAAMFAVLGGVTLLNHFYNLNNIKSKTVGDGQHGTARWATKKEIRKTYKHIPFTPKRWREQAKHGKTPTVARVVKHRKKKHKLVCVVVLMSLLMLKNAVYREKGHYLHIWFRTR